MRTRTLLLLAVSCGLLILVAGGIQLWRLANQDEGAPALAVGDTGTAGDAVVVVESVDATGDPVVVTVTLSGVDDPDGLDGFGLVAPGRVVPVDASLSSCDGFTTAPMTCTLAFPSAGLTGQDRQLVFRRAEEQARWILV